MDDVRSAAERKRNPSGYTRINGERCSPEENADNETLARAWLAEHVADDGEPVSQDLVRDQIIRVWRSLERSPEEWAKRAYRELSRVLLHFLVADVGDELAKAMRNVR